MTDVLDMSLAAILAAIFVALVAYKLFLLFRYRNDPAKREVLTSSGLIFPKRLAKWIYDEYSETAPRKSSPTHSSK